MKALLKQKKAVAGLNVYLSLITMLFMIGIVVFVFMIAGNKLASATYDSSTGSAANETLTTVTETGEYLSVYTYRGVTCSIGLVTNSTSGAIIPAANYTVTDCHLAATATSSYNNTNWNVSYSYSYSGDNEITVSINETTKAIGTSTDFFPTFIVLGSMIVLVLLTVIIINSIRATGITQEGA